MRLIDADALCIPPEEMNAKMAVAYAPTIDAVPVKHGEWICDGGLYRCSACNELWLGWNTKTPMEQMKKNCPYCPNCGAKMDGGKDDDKR